MAAVNYYSINVAYDSALAADQQWKATVMYKPTAASSPTSPSTTTGPLGSGGSAAATRVNGAGSAVGFNDVVSAILAALPLVAGDRSVGN